MERIRVHQIKKDTPANLWQRIVKFFHWDSKEVFQKGKVWMVTNVRYAKEQWEKGGDNVSKVEERGYSITLTVHRFQGKARLVIWENIPNKESEPTLTKEMAKHLKEAQTIIKSLQ